MLKFTQFFDMKRIGNKGRDGALRIRALPHAALDETERGSASSSFATQAALRSTHRATCYLEMLRFTDIRLIRPICPIPKNLPASLIPFRHNNFQRDHSRWTQTDTNGHTPPKN
jgi:hypothetical protein